MKEIIIKDYNQPITKQAAEICRGILRAKRNRVAHTTPKKLGPPSEEVANAFTPRKRR